MEGYLAVYTPTNSSLGPPFFFFVASLGLRSGHRLIGGFPTRPRGRGDAHGRAPLFRPVITFLPSRHRNKVDRFINRRGIIGLVGFAVTHLLIRAPLDRFRVGLMAEIPAHENFKNTKTSKTSQISLGPREKLLGRAGLVL